MQPRFLLQGANFKGFAQHSDVPFAVVYPELGPAEFGEGVSLTDTAKEIGDQFGVQSLRVLADLSVAEDVDRAVAEIVAKYGRIDILVHNAGGDIAADGGKADPNDAVMIKDEDVLSIMNNNLQSSILICQRVSRVMIPQHEGRIILVSSVAGLAVSAGGNQTMYGKLGWAHPSDYRAEFAVVHPFAFALSQRLRRQA